VLDIILNTSYFNYLSQVETRNFRVKEAHASIFGTRQSYILESFTFSMRRSGELTSMSSCHTGRFVVLKAMIGSLVASVLVITGCSSEVGSTPSGKQEMNNYLAKEAADAAATTKSGKPVPKSIKSKLLSRPAEPNK
jgi:hypothetical protein